MMPYFRIHCAACGGVECHRLAEIVKLTGVESDQHLIEWVEQAKERERQLREAGEAAIRFYDSVDWSLSDDSIARGHEDAIELLRTALTVPPAKEKP